MDSFDAVLALLLFLLVLYIAYALYLAIPIGMARARRRDAVAWVLLGIFTSPFFTIFLLWLLGDAGPNEEDAPGS